ncbi:unnamed protein product [Onchocerca flexuosa]|uniref:EB domain-containing protein n=1 Tax=Onchocerca flexuosa TaxID=387005 RepID=A0A183GXP5_9BILA|nr:unnamed protein product [Onchocerca flexuosa]
MPVIRTEKTLASKCKTSAECMGRGEYCNKSSGKCLCLSTHLRLDGKCKPVIYPGQSGCDDSRQCAEGYPGAICTSQKRCQCPKGFKTKAFSCFKSKFYTGKRYTPQRRRSQPLRISDRNNFTEKAKYNPSGISTVNGTAFSSLCPMQQVYIQEVDTCMTTRLPGELCQYSEQCATIEPGAFCQRLRCKCALGMKFDGNSCTFTDPKCAVHGYVWVPEMDECMQVLSPGTDGCTHSIQCSTVADNAYCFRHKCTCPDNLIPVDGTCGEQCPTRMTFSAVIGQCIPAIKPGGKCQYSSQCQTDDNEMICVRGICRCFGGKVFTGDRCAESCPRDHIVDKNGICRKGCLKKLNTFLLIFKISNFNYIFVQISTQIEHKDKCYDQILPGQSCIVDSQCMGGFRCVKNICVCPSSMMIRNGLCRQRKVAPMQSCNYGQVCLGGSFCHAGICVCPAGFIKMNEECVLRATVPPSSTCNSAVRCGGGSICIADICECPDFKEPVNGICEMSPAVLLGDSCPTGNERCLGGSSCLFGICECPFGTVPKYGECISERKVPVGSRCKSTQTCLGLATCIEGICQCPDGMILQDGECHYHTFVGVGSSCANGEFCDGGSICLQSICLCPPGTTNQNGLCLAEQKKNYEETCMNGETCIDNLLCIDGICQCPQGMFSSSGQCILTTTDSLVKCSNSSQCTGNSYCDHQSGLCICQDGFQYRNQSCMPVFTRALISPIKACITSADCMIGAKCHCPAGEIFTGGRCQMVFAEAGESCLNGETCTSNYVCINGSCSCPDGEISRNGNCVTEDTEIKKYTRYQAEPHSSCSKGELCIGGSFCNVVDGLCRCPANTILQNGRCEFANEQSVFTLPPQQVFNRSGNMLNESLNGTVINVNRITIRLNRCENSNDCKGGSYCLGYQCICPFNMIMKDGLCLEMSQNSCKKDFSMNHRIGGRCSTNQECTIRNTVCHNGICICLPGYRISGDTECVPVAVPFPKTHLQTIIPTTTTIIAMSNNIDNNSKMDEMAANEVIDSRIKIDSDEISLDSDSALFTALPLIDASIERIPSSPQTEMIVNISGGVCNETTLCLFFSICHNGICKCPLGTGISDTECKFTIDVNRLRQFEKMLNGDYSALTYSTLPIKQTTHLLSTTAEIHPFSSVEVTTKPANRVSNIKEVWPTVHSQMKPKSVTSMSIRCQTSQQCPSRAECIDGLCNCISGTAMSQYGFCIPVHIESSPGMSCFNGETCIGFSKCVQGICTCPPEWNNIIDNECARGFRGENTLSVIS